MAERKSDYTGDRFGDWEVIGRVTLREDWMEKGKRYWSVARVNEHDVTEFRVVEQTKLKLLPNEDVIAPVKLVTVGSNLLNEGWAAPLAVDPEHFDYSLTDDEDYHIGEAPPVAPKVTMATLDAALGIKPMHASEIAAKCIEAKDVFVASQVLAEAEASVAIDSGEIGTYTFAIDQEAHDWSHDLPVDYAPVIEGIGDGQERSIPTWTLDEGQVERFGGIGEAAETMVSEAELDARAAEIGQDPMRALVRTLIGQIHTLREQAETMEGQVVELLAQADNLMDVADAILKEVITR